MTEKATPPRSKHSWMQRESRSSNASSIRGIRISPVTQRNSLRKQRCQLSRSERIQKAFNVIELRRRRPGCAIVDVVPDLISEIVSERHSIVFAGISSRVRPEEVVRGIVVPPETITRQRVARISGSVPVANTSKLVNEWILRLFVPVVSEFMEHR